MQLGSLAEFSLLDYVARRSFSTLTSVCFDLGVEEQFSFSEAPRTIIDAFRVKGWLEIHHPCDGHHKAQIRLAIPEPFEDWETTELVRSILFARLAIPDDETWVMEVFSIGRTFSFMQDVDRHGMTSGTICGIELGEAQREKKESSQ